jgi:SnoaL-like domain
VDGAAVSTADVTDIVQLVLHERQSRDRGWWVQMADCFHPESSVYLSWFSGTGPDFVAASRDRVTGGIRPAHRMSPPVVHVSQDRAVAEVPAAIEVRSVIDETEIDLVSYTRLLYQVERNEATWLIRSLTCIYERDTLNPVVPGSPLALEPNRLAEVRPSYRYLGYFFGLRGGTVSADLYGDDQPERVAELYHAAFAWMRDTTRIDS